MIIFFQISSQNTNLQQDILSTGVQHLHIANETPTNVISSNQGTNQEDVQVTQPKFLSGVPMVNPGGYSSPIENVTMSVVDSNVTTNIPQSSMSQAQSMVSNMAAYSSSKYSLVMEKKNNIID